MEALSIEDKKIMMLRDALREDYRLIGGGQSLSKKDAELRIKGGGFQSITGATPK